MAISRLFLVWKILAKNILHNQVRTFSSSILFVLGKVANLLFSIITIMAIFTAVGSVGQYTLQMAVIVNLVFMLIDSVTQFLFRSLYSFRPILLKGDFDLDLLKPLPSFFRPIFSGPDFLDLPLIIIQLSLLFYFTFSYQLVPDFSSIILFIVVFVNSLVVAFAIHLAIAAFSIITTEIDSLVMIYRSFGRSAVVPTEIYQPTFRFVITYIIPITLLFTIPAKTLLGLISLPGVLLSSLVSVLLCLLSLYFWKIAIARYTSASS